MRNAEGAPFPAGGRGVLAPRASAERRFSTSGAGEEEFPDFSGRNNVTIGDGAPRAARTRRSHRAARTHGTYGRRPVGRRARGAGATTTSRAPASRRGDDSARRDRRRSARTGVRPGARRSRRSTSRSSPPRSGRRRASSSRASRTASRRSASVPASDDGKWPPRDPKHWSLFGSPDRLCRSRPQGNSRRSTPPRSSRPSRSASASGTARRPSRPWSWSARSASRPASVPPAWRAT